MVIVAGSIEGECGGIGENVQLCGPLRIVFNPNDNCCYVTVSSYGKCLFYSYLIYDSLF